MDSRTIMLIAAFFAASFLLMIPFYLVQKKRKKKEDGFLQDQRGMAILRLYGEGATIDGIRAKDLEHVRGEMLEQIVSLTPGTHIISAKYGSSEPGIGGNTNYKTPKPIDCEINFEAGHEYSISLYFYSPEERYNYYKGDVGEAVFCQELDIYGGSYSKGYIICYKEK